MSITRANAPMMVSTALDLLETERGDKLIAMIDDLITDQIKLQDIHDKAKLGTVWFELFVTGTQLFDGMDQFEQWLCQPAYGLRDERPVDIVNTQDGAAQVITLMNRIMHGIVA